MRGRMGEMANPYKSPLLGQASAARKPLSRLSAAKSALWSITLAAILGCGLVVAGWFVGPVFYDMDPPFWNNAIYPSGVFGDDHEEKVRIQTGIRFALSAGAVGFWGGLFAPWSRYAWLRYQNKMRDA